MKILVIGGNRFFGKKLVERLIKEDHSITLLNRGSIEDGFGDRVERIHCNRTDKEALQNALGQSSWDIVYDQVCFDYQTAKDACEVFAGKVSRYIYTSSQSVYEPGKNLSEADFKPEGHKFEVRKTKDSDYAEAKRQAEVGFYEAADFPVALLRFPIVIGHDDYTKRFVFHVDHIKEGQEIYFPNINARISFITSDFAAETLAALCEKEFVGPLNAASPAPITLARFVEIIEDITGKKAKLAEQGDECNHSPYGIDQDWFMDCGKLAELGLVGKEIEKWLPSLLR